MNSYTIFIIFGLVIFCVTAAMIIANKILGPKPKFSKIKYEPFECGAMPIESQNVKSVHLKFYAFAVFFVLLDLETIFLYLWALGAQPITGDMIITILLFIAILEIVLLYIVHSGFVDDLTK